MSKVAITGNASGTGTLTIAAPNTNTDRTLTLPDEAGTVLTSGGAIDVDPSAPADSVAIDSSGNVGIGTSSPSQKLDVSNGHIRVNEDGVGTKAITIRSDWAGVDPAINVTTNNSLLLMTNNTERARIDSSGNLLVGKTGLNGATVGCQLEASGIGGFSVSGNNPLYLNRISNDGTIVSIRQDNVQEGTISVSGTTVSYNGGHLARWSQLADNTRDETILKGTVMTNLDQMAEWTTDGVTEANEQLNCMAVSSVEGDPNVAGVFVNWDNDDDVYTNDMNIAMTGDMIIRIAAGTTVARGDLLMSAGDGTAKPQGDDIVRSKTIAKVTSTHVTFTYDDGSYCVPCVLMAC